MQVSVQVDAYGKFSAVVSGRARAYFTHQSYGLRRRQGVIPDFEFDDLGGPPILGELKGITGNRYCSNGVTTLACRRDAREEYPARIC